MKELKSSGGGRFMYGKAWTYRVGWKKFLRSFDTVVCSVGRGGRVRRLWDGYSKSTMAHIKAFLLQETGREWTWREFYDLPLDPRPERQIWYALSCNGVFCPFRYASGDYLDPSLVRGSEKACRALCERLNAKAKRAAR